MRWRGPAFVCALAMVGAACGTLEGSPSGTDTSKTDDASAPDGAGSGDHDGDTSDPRDGGDPDASPDAGPELAATVFAKPTDAANTHELGLDLTYLWWARPGVGVFRSPLVGGTTQNAQNVNAAGVAVDSARVYASLVPNDAGFTSCEVRSWPINFASSLVEYTEPCVGGDFMTLALEGTRLYMVGPGVQLRVVDLTQQQGIAAVSVTGIGYAEGDGAGRMFFTDPSSTGKGRILEVVGTSTSEILVSDYELRGLAVTPSYFYATGTKATGERVILRAGRGAPAVVDRVWSRPANAVVGDIAALPSGRIFWVESDQILEAMAQ
jgi:hypothetical protein